MAHKKRFPTCTHCGAQNENTKAATTFTANDGELPGWDLKCGWCDKHFLVVMVPLPAHASMSGLDDGLRLRRRNDARRRYGYEHPAWWMSSRGAKRLESDRVEATISIRPGHVVAGLRKRIGPASNEPLVIGGEEVA